MMIRLFRNGLGGGKGPVDNLCNAVVPKYDPDTSKPIPNEVEVRDPPPRVLAGDPARCCMLIDHNPHKWKYTAGVIAFAIDDKPTESQIQAVIVDFQRAAFAGLERSQYHILWVCHTHLGTTSLHFIAPRVELSSGKSLNIAPPGAERLFNAFRDVWNLAEGWARPNDPKRARSVHIPNHCERAQAVKRRKGLEGNSDPRLDIANQLQAEVDQGLIKSRADIVRSLVERGFAIIREAKDFLSVRAKDGKVMRLKGALFVASFGQVDSSVIEDPAQAAAAARLVLADIVHKRAAYHRQRYPLPEVIKQRELEKRAPSSTLPTNQSLG